MTNKQLVYDFTRYIETKTSLEKYLDINESDILSYIIGNKDSWDTDEFLETFNISDEKLLATDLVLVSLHVTTTNDKFDSLKRYGLLNLQDVLEKDTPLKKFLDNLKIYIDVANKKISYNNKVYDISKKYEDVSNPVDAFIRKLYMDYQINSFFNYDNVLNYGVQKRPEFFIELSKLLKVDLSNAWIQQKKECFVIKFHTPLSNIESYTFDISKKDQQYLDHYQLELLKRKWVIKNSLSKIEDDFFYSSSRECYCYLKSNVSVPYSDIIKIYTPDEYLKEYRTED
ncbi:hypothetical protein [Exiguobacterium sp. s91]|uniref:hypothetical protein n=1 Tax=Exiguobacterium sp. s91 TaxID=2751199 RepID=UPI001BE9C750|nr:hypothetical protein [Exiguobacterium sp. s91]